jgi:hypothetical protein
VQRTFGSGIVSRVTPVHTAVRNSTRDEGGPFEVGNQVLISSRRKLLSSKAMVVNVAEKSERDFGRGPWRQSGVLKEPRVQLVRGLIRTKPMNDLGADGAPQA